MRFSLSWPAPTPFTHGARVRRWLLLGVLVLLGSLSARPLLAAPTPRSTAEVPAICAEVTAIPVTECGALVDLYQATGGRDWASATNWLQIDANTTPCDWYGVTCAGGAVQGLDLARNGLSGRLPSSLGQLTQLQRLDMAGNRIGPQVAAGICELVDTVVEADLGYNRLELRSANKRACLDAMDSDWRATQTVAPRDANIPAIDADGVVLSWTPILYTDDGGYYEISYSTSFSGEYTVHGVTADRTATSYRVDGLARGTSYFFQIRSVTPPHAAHPDELRSDPAGLVGVTQGEQRMLLAVVISADNNLTEHVASIMRRIRQGTALNPNLTAVVLADRRGDEDSTLSIIEGGAITMIDILPEVWGSREVDMADPTVLAWFLRYARETVQPDRTIVSLVGHGVGPTPHLAWVPPTPPEEPPATPIDGIPPLPRGLDYTPADVTDGTYLSTADLARALLAATDDGASPFDILFFDQCFQGNLDVLYEVRRAADVFIASPNYAWLVAPYAQYISQMAPAADNEAIAESIISRYQANLNDRHPNAIFWARRSDIDQIASAVSGLADALLAALNDGKDDAIRTAAANAAFVDTTQCGRGEFVLSPPDELVGAGSLALNLSRAFPDGDAYGVHAGAEQLLATLRNLSSTARSGSPYIAPEARWTYNDRITILAPLARNLPPSVVWRASVYQAAEEQAAVWTPDPTQTVLVQGTYAFVEEQRWDEFINAWYGELTPTIGNWCHYTPPSIVLDDDAEMLTLAAESGEEGVRLIWTAPVEADAAAYQLLGRVPGGIGLELLEVLPATTNMALLAELFPGEYDFLLVAVGESDQPLAQSGEVGVAVEWAASIYLPLVR